MRMRFFLVVRPWTGSERRITQFDWCLDEQITKVDPFNGLQEM
jgi:hypothetical protein